MDMYTIWVSSFMFVSILCLLTSHENNTNLIVLLRLLPFFLFLWFICFSLDYVRPYNNIYSEIYKNGNLVELTNKIKQTKEYNEYKFQEDWIKNNSKKDNK